MDSQLVQVVLVAVGGAVARRSIWRGGATTALLPGVAAEPRDKHARGGGLSGGGLNHVNRIIRGLRSLTDTPAVKISTLAGWAPRRGFPVSLPASRSKVTE